MIDARIVAGLVVSSLGCSTPPTVALSHARTDAGAITAPDGSDMITTHTTVTIFVGSRAKVTAQGGATAR